ncbi:MAG: SUMF1/EgtB/PvdO family nonheme iron enzyme [Acetobacteraceae bacterium]|nr:SUMF1/EgtB/PvdO family nonheme iron enzyme [Acetobacteraceae bacterium]
MARSAWAPSRPTPEEAPVHTATVSGFWMDEYVVTNAEFAAVIEAPATAPSRSARLIAVSRRPTRAA